MEPDKRIKQLSLFWIAFVCLIVLGVKYSVHKDNIQHTHISREKKLVEVECPYKLESKIPSLTRAAVRQKLYPIVLRKLDQVVLKKEYEALSESLVVMDKVVVIPKIIG